MRLVDREGLQAYLCGISRWTVRRYEKQRMPYIQAVKGSPRLYDLDEVDAWLKRDKTQPVERPLPEAPRRRGKKKKGHWVDLAARVAALDMVR